MSVKTLQACVKKHGKAKTAVAIGLRDTNAIANWISRKEIPDKYKDDVKKLSKLKLVIARFNVSPEQS